MKIFLTEDGNAVPTSGQAFALTKKGVPIPKQCSEKVKNSFETNDC